MCLREMTKLWIHLGAVGLVISLQCSPALGKIKLNEQLDFSGDFRFRIEHIKDGTSIEQNRQGIRARMGVEYSPDEDTSATFQLASGNDDSPTSTNQPLDDSFTSKPVYIDLAFLKWEASSEFVLLAGKIKSPYGRLTGAGLVWDSDVRPEGVHLVYNPWDNLFASLSAFTVEERPLSTESWLIASSLESDINITDDDNLTAKFTSLTYSNTAGQEVFAGFSRGNSTTSSTVGTTTTEYYTKDYHLLQGTLVYSRQMGPHPIKVYFDYVVNSAIPTENQGWLVGFKMNKIRQKGDWSLDYNYRHLEKDAVIGAFTDGNFSGGGTDGIGHILFLDYGLSKSITSRLSLFANSQGVNNTIDYYRGQLDFSLKF